MFQVIDNKPVYVVDFDTMPKLPITGLTASEALYQHALYSASAPYGPHGTLARMGSKITYATALQNAFETGVITEPGKYGIYLVPGTYNYKIYTIVE